MATLSTIADARCQAGAIDGACGHSSATSSISDRFWRAALMAMVVALGALFGFTASAQQNPEPRPEPAPPTAMAPSTPPASVSSATASWQKSLVARLARLQQYPPQARGVQGVVSLSLQH